MILHTICAQTQIPHSPQSIYAPAPIIAPPKSNKKPRLPKPTQSRAPKQTVLTTPNICASADPLTHAYATLQHPGRTVSPYGDMSASTLATTEDMQPPQSPTPHTLPPHVSHLGSHISPLSSVAHTHTSLASLSPFVCPFYCVSAWCTHTNEVHTVCSPSPDEHK